MERSLVQPPFEVFVNVYELQPKYKWTKFVGIGLFHSAVEVFGLDVAFGGH